MPKPSERTWVVDLYDSDPETGQIFFDQEALPRTLLELAPILHRLGGVIQIATRRSEFSPGQIVTTALVIRHRSFVPLDKAQSAPPIEQDGTEAQEQATASSPTEELPEDEPIEEPTVEMPTEELAAAKG